MHERIQDRLTQLRAEHENGQRMLAELDARRDSLRTTLLRIAGAVQVLEELLSGNLGTDALPARGSAGDGVTVPEPLRSRG